MSFRRNKKSFNITQEEPKDEPGTIQMNGVKSQDYIGKVSTPALSINRTAYHTAQFNDDFIPIPTTTSDKLETFKMDCSGKAWIRRLRGLFPITLWLPEYDLRENLVADIIVGITIAIFQVPQSMAYCLICQVPPIYGLYSSFFPVLIYTILGTGQHVSFGTFAITSGVMTGDIVTQVLQQLGKTSNPTLIGTPGPAQLTTTTISSNSVPIATVVDEFPDLKNIEIAIMIALMIGIYIFAFGVLQLGFVSSFMSDELISGFMTAASIITFFTQIKNMIGVNLATFSGPGNLPIAVVNMFQRLHESNPPTLIITAVTIIILLIFKLGVNRLTARLGIKTPFPIELCVMVGGTLLSHYMGLQYAPYHVKIVGTIGNNFPNPINPRYKLFPILWDKCIAIAIVSFTVTYSVSKIYGKKHGYKPDANQEMIAIGAANIIVGYFQCIPAAASIPRSAVQETAGGKTQIVSFVNCICLVVVIMALGKYLQELPTCVLGSCIAIALISIFSQFGEFVRYWRVSKLDGMIWLITCLSVLLISVDIGIYIGLICSILLLVYKSERPKVYLLGTVDELEIYVPINKFNKAVELKGFKIFQMCGPLNFSNIEYFSNNFEHKCGVDVTDIVKYTKSKKYKKILAKIEKTSDGTLPKLTLTRMALDNYKLPQYIVIDCSMFSFIDLTGITFLKKTIETCEQIGIKVVLSGIQVHLESMLAKANFFEDISKESIYKTVHDAVLYLKEFDHILNTQSTGNGSAFEVSWL